jgi:hypothetical protein
VCLFKFYVPVFGETGTHFVPVCRNRHLGICCDLSKLFGIERTQGNGMQRAKTTKTFEPLLPPICPRKQQKDQAPPFVNHADKTPVPPHPPFLECVHGPNLGQETKKEKESTDSA